MCIGPLRLCFWWVIFLIKEIVYAVAWLAGNGCCCLVENFGPSPGVLLCYMLWVRFAVL